jgi:hypothetical protein
MSIGQFVDANSASNVAQRNPHKRPSGTPSLSSDVRNNAKRSRQILHSDSQNVTNEPSLRWGQAKDDDSSSNVVKPEGTKLASGLSRQQFTRFKLSPKKLRLAL